MIRAFPANGDVLHQVTTLPGQGRPFFSRDGHQLYLMTEHSLYAYPVLPEKGGGFRLGERSLLFQVDHPMRADINVAAVSRDGRRFLIMATDTPEEARVQFFSDWTSLLSH
jgi:hypothetical protein